MTSKHIKPFPAKHRLIFAVVLMLIAASILYFIIEAPVYVTAGTCIPLLFLLVLFPPLTQRLLHSWMQFAHFIGMVNSTLLLGFFFLFVITPAAFILRLTGRQPLRQQTVADNESYATPSPLLEPHEMERPY